MLARTYIEALLVDEGLVDEVWEAWDAKLVSDEGATWAWLLISIHGGYVRSICADYLYFLGVAAS